MRRGLFGRCLLALNLILTLAFSPELLGQLTLSSPVPGWVPIAYGTTNHPDFVNDQQTGSAEGDIVGSETQSGFYMKYVEATAGDLLAFRLRLGADLNPQGFKGAALVGIDANLDGGIDLFVGVNNQGNNQVVGIWNPGDGLNASPSTTTVVPTPVRAYAETSTTYSLTPVTATSDPFGTSADLNGDGKTDQLLSFALPMADLAEALAAMGIEDFTANSPMRLIAVTATQINSFNQDLSGVRGGLSSNATWDQLGALSQPYTPTSTVPVPEPSPLSLVIMFGAGVAARRVCRPRGAVREK